MILLALWLGCADEDDKVEETAETGEVAAACVSEDGSGGTVTGEVSCGEDGRCVVPEGLFWRGSDGSDYQDECPAKQIMLSSFQIDRTEVTQRAYQTCVDAGTCEPVSEGCMGEDDGDDRPAICVSWDMAVTYCASRGGRLPTEAEWEKAARGTDGAEWAWGYQPPDCNAANFRYVAAYCQHSVIEVGSYDEVSAYGLVDTVGNAWEWTSDWYDASWYELAADTDPVGPEADCHEVVGGPADECLFKVIRGGAYNTTESTTRGAARSLAKPAIIDDNIGFRCAYDG